jgi:hypothetical protein
VILKTYAYKKSKIDVIFYEIALHDQEYCLSWRDANGLQGWLGWRDTLEECQAMLPSEAREVK